MIVLIDNYDSFTFNLVHYLGALGADVSVWRNDEISVAEVVAARQKRGPKQTVHEAPHVVFATDPVCGMTVDTTDAANTATHDGQTYFFCCSGCREQFVAEPARFLRATAG